MSQSLRRTPQPISRRRLFAAGGLALSVLALGTEAACAQTHGSPRPQGSTPVEGSPAFEASPSKRTVIGSSQGGQPITVYQLGGDRRRVLVLSGQHGSPEGNAVTLADAILDYFGHHERDIPKGVGLDVITIANPDGYIDGTRQFRSGVDP